jgi:hypothetical protein
MTYSYHPHARKELDDAANFYNGIDFKLGDDFLEGNKRTSYAIIIRPTCS